MKLRSLLAAVSVSVLVLAAPSAASAAAGTILSVSVTTPTTGSKFFADRTAGAPASNVTFSGTSTDDGPGATFDLVCYRRNSADSGWYTSQIVGTIDPAADGTWTTPVDMSTTPVAIGDGCLVRGVPSGTTPDLAVSPQYTGPTVYFANAYRRKVSGGANAGVVYGWHAQVGQSAAYNDFGSPFTEGVYDSHLYTGANLRESENLWWQNAALRGATGYPFDGVSGLMVDGNYGWLPEAAQGRSFAGTNGEDLAGFVGIDVSFTHDPATGAVNVVETHPILRCNEGATVLVPPVTCTSLVSTGVSLMRTTTFNADGTEVRVVDAFRSADGSAHAVKAQYYESHSSAAAASFALPWVSSGAYGTLVASQSLPLPPSGPWTYFARGLSTAPDGDIANPQGARIVSNRPTAFNVETANANDLVQLHEFNVPAAGEFVMQHGFAISSQRSALDAASTKFTDLFVKPSVTITTPVAGSEVTTTPVTVAGTVSDNVAVTSFTVNGVAVTPAAGAFSTKLTLTTSPSTITVVAKDAAGNETTATATVTFKALTFTGTSGKDTLTGNSLANRLEGLEGDDTIDCGAGGKDVALGGAGNDTISCVEPFATAKANADTVNCGAGRKDVAIVDPFDRVLGCEKVTRVWKGGARRDVFRPTKVSNDRFETLGGNDKVTCSGGSDVVLAGAGNDAINCFDAGSNRKQRASRDTVNCGAGRKDVAIVDAYDRVIGCEKVIRRP